MGLRDLGYVVLHNQMPDALAQRLLAQAKRERVVYHTIFNRFVEYGVTDADTADANGERGQLCILGNQSKLRDILLAALSAHVPDLHSRTHKLRRLVFLQRTPGCRKQHTHRDAESGYFVIAPLTPNYGVCVVPRSHMPGQKEELATACWLDLQVGDLFIGDARVLHSGGGNADTTPAYSVHAFYHTTSTPLLYEKTITPSEERLEQMHAHKLD